MQSALPPPPPPPWLLNQLPEIDEAFAQRGGSTPSPAVVLVAALSKRTNFSVLAGDLRKHFDGWDCVAVAWHSRVLSNVDVADAPGDDGAAFLRSRCVIVLREGMKWGSLVNLTRGAIARRGYEHVALLLDDVKLGGSFNATELIHLSRTHRLGVLSPRVGHATYDLMQGKYAPRGWPHSAERVVRLTALEQYATLYSRAAWGCMTSLMDDAVSRDGADEMEPRCGADAR